MLENPLFNPGGYFTNIKSFESIEANWTSIGEIVNLTQDGEYQSGLIQRYDVLIYNMNQHVVKGCIPITSNFSGNGVGEYATYKVGDAVIITSLYNNYDSVVILGSVSLPGDMELLMGEKTERSKMRKLQGDNSYAPQPLITPDRAQNPSANKFIISSTHMDKDSYKNPDLIASSADRATLVNEQALPTGVEIDSGLGDKGTYFRGLEYKYINGSYYHIVVADKEDECAKASKVAKVALDNVNKLRKLIPAPRNSNSLIDSKYRADENQKIYEIALETAKKCNTKALANKQATTAITAANKAASAVKVDSTYKPKENKLEVKTSTTRDTISNERVVKFIEVNNLSLKILYNKYNLPVQDKASQELINKIVNDPILVQSLIRYETNLKGTK